MKLLNRLMQLMGTETPMQRLRLRPKQKQKLKPKLRQKQKQSKLLQRVLLL